MASLEQNAANTLAPLKIDTQGGFWALVVGYLTSMVIFEKLLLILLAAIACDLITGTLAYREEWRKSGKPKHKAFLFQSEGVRRTLHKGGVYLLLIGIVAFLTLVIFPDLRISFGGVMTPLKVYEFFTLLLITLETYSNIENLKRMGVDIFGMVGDFLGKIVNLKEKVKDLKS